MSSSASSISSAQGPSRHGRIERAVARVLVAALVSAHPLSASAGDEFSDANSASFDRGSVALDNQQAGRTTFTIGSDRTTIGWQDLQQPENNRLEFNFTNAGGRGASVLNYSEALNPIEGNKFAARDCGTISLLASNAYRADEYTGSCACASR